MILNLKELKYYYLTIPQNINRIENIEKNLNDLNLTRVDSVLDDKLSKFQSGALGFFKMIDIATNEYTNTFIPFGLLEDDVNKYRDFPDFIDIPDNTDILYIGTSIYGYNHSIKWANLNVFTESIDKRKDIYKINNMLSTHGFIITSKQGLHYCIKSMEIAKHNNIHYDIILAGMQNHYNVYCLKTPLVYQDGKVGGSEDATKRELKLNLLNVKIPDNYILNNYIY